MIKYLKIKLSATVYSLILIIKCKILIKIKIMSFVIVFILADYYSKYAKLANSD